MGPPLTTRLGVEARLSGQRELAGAESGPGAELVAGGARSAGIAPPGRNLVVARGRARGAPVEGVACRVGLSERPAGRAWGQDPELIDGVGIGAAAAAGRDGDRGA